jgi:uncharacterized surface protein with fasciclin (FAS1) repeats
MLRARLLTATAAIALFGAGAAFTQDATPAQTAPAQPAAEVSTQAQTPASTNSVVDVLREQGQFSTLLSALDAAQLTETLRTQPAVSIFAPTDAAFAALPEAERTRLLDPANVNELRQLLLYHVIVADVNSSQIEGALGGVETAARTQVQLDGTGDAIKIDAATVTQADIDAGNGAIFVIDRVLNPAQSLVATGDAEEATTPPADADATMTDDGMDGDMDAGEVAPPPTNPSPEADPAVTAPSGEAATSVETVTSPPVENPTDGQMDDTPETEEPQS